MTNQPLTLEVMGQRLADGYTPLDKEEDMDEFFAWLLFFGYFGTLALLVLLALKG